jgi:hypothetical protein
MRTFESSGHARADSKSKCSKNASLKLRRITKNTIEQEFRAYQEKNGKLKSQLPTGKNLAMLQGISRREKDA